MGQLNTPFTVGMEDQLLAGSGEVMESGWGGAVVMLVVGVGDVARKVFCG